MVKRSPMWFTGLEGIPGAVLQSLCPRSPSGPRSPGRQSGPAGLSASRRQNAGETHCARGPPGPTKDRQSKSTSIITWGKISFAGERPETRQALRTWMRAESYTMSSYKVTFPTWKLQTQFQRKSIWPTPYSVQVCKGLEPIQAFTEWNVWKYCSAAPHPLLWRMEDKEDQACHNHEDLRIIFS